MTATERLREDVKMRIDSADEKMLKMVQAMLEVDDQHDWWDDLSDAAKASIEQGLVDTKKGKLTPHAEVMQNYKKWL
jgi:predicted transcriptional regulator